MEEKKGNCHCGCGVVDNNHKEFFRTKAWYFSSREIELMRNGMQRLVLEGDPTGEKEELLNDLEMCIRGVL